MRRFALVMVALFAGASLTGGALQELLASLAYVGLGIAAATLYIERYRSNHRGV